MLGIGGPWLLNPPRPDDPVLTEAEAPVTGATAAVRSLAKAFPAEEITLPVWALWETSTAMIATPMMPVATVTKDDQNSFIFLTSRFSSCCSSGFLLGC